MFRVMLLLTDAPWSHYLFNFTILLLQVSRYMAHKTLVILFFFFLFCCIQVDVFVVNVLFYVVCNSLSLYSFFSYLLIICNRSNLYEMLCLSYNTGNQGWWDFWFKRWNWQAIKCKECSIGLEVNWQFCVWRFCVLSYKVWSYEN